MNPATPSASSSSQPTAPVPAAAQKPARQFKLDSKNLRLILLGSLAFSVLLFAIVLLLGLSLLGKQSQKMVDLKVQSQTADVQLSNLEKAKKQVETYSFFKDIAKTVIPSDKDQAASVIEINKMAQESGINIQGITFPASSLGLTTGSISNASSAQDATAGSSASKAISQAKPVSGIAGLYSLELTITPQSDAKTPPNKVITYAKMLDFLKRIENNRHTAQITDVNISPASAQSNSATGLTFSLTTNIFIKP
jgi:type II secretory pathway pseudopilin PulG